MMNDYASLKAAMQADGYKVSAGDGWNHIDALSYLSWGAGKALQDSTTTASVQNIQYGLEFDEVMPQTIIESVAVQAAKSSSLLDDEFNTNTALGSRTTDSGAHWVTNAADGSDPLNASTTISGGHLSMANDNAWIMARTDATIPQTYQATVVLNVNTNVSGFGAQLDLYSRYTATDPDTGIGGGYDLTLSFSDPSTLTATLSWYDNSNNTYSATSAPLTISSGQMTIDYYVSNARKMVYINGSPLLNVVENLYTGTGAFAFSMSSIGQSINMDSIKVINLPNSIPNPTVLPPNKLVLFDSYPGGEKFVNGWNNITYVLNGVNYTRGPVTEGQTLWEDVDMVFTQGATNNLVLNIGPVAGSMNIKLNPAFSNQWSNASGTMTKISGSSWMTVTNNAITCDTSHGSISGVYHFTDTNNVVTAINFTVNPS